MIHFGGPSVSATGKTAARNILPLIRKNLPHLAHSSSSPYEPLIRTPAGPTGRRAYGRVSDRKPPPLGGAVYFGRRA